MKNLLDRDNVVITEHDFDDFGFRRYDAKIVFQSSVRVPKELSSSDDKFVKHIKEELHSQLEYDIYKKTYEQNRKVKSMVDKLEHFMSTVNLSNANMSDQDYDNMDRLLDFIADIKSDFT